MEGYAGEIREREFLQAYLRTTLRVPQVASDSLLRSMVTAAEADRPALLAALAAMAARAARQLVAVTSALADRSRPVSHRLQGPLPSADAWAALIQQVGTRPPAAIADHLGVGGSGVVYLERMRALGDLSWMTPLVRLAEHDGLLVGGTNEWRHQDASVVAVVDGTVIFALREEDAASVADITAELVAVARGLLRSYLEGRSEAQG